MNHVDIYNEDCMFFMRGVKDKSFNLTVTDIPYGEVNRKSNGLRNLDKGDADVETFPLETFLDEVCRVTSGSVYIFCGTEQVSDIRKRLIINGMSTRLCIWKKTNPSPMNGDKIWLSGIECCVYGKFPKATFNYHCVNTVFEFPCGRKKFHPTEKPVKLMEYIIGASSNEGDTVFDPCMGSGTTGVACLNLGREFVGCELSKEHFSVAEDRLDNTQYFQQELKLA